MDYMSSASDYQQFIDSKRTSAKLSGFDVSASAINPMLFDWQQAVDRWALRLGKAALFEECGLGKTAQQLEWAKHVANHTRQQVLVLTPLAVAHQTIREGIKFGVEAVYCREQAEADRASTPIIVANYDVLHKLDPLRYAGVVLDESSILKNFTGKTKRQLIGMFAQTPYKLACTATPAPNDYLELGNHADFLDIMPSNEMIARWFINNTMEAGDYRLKGHAEKDFWRWITSWAVCISKPSDLGSQYSDAGFILPELRIHQEIVAVDHERAFGQGRLLLDGALSATNLWAEKRATSADRARRAAEILSSNDSVSWAIWCDTDDEADRLKALIPEAVEVRGSHSPKIKEERLNAFSEGSERIIITKPDIAGFGLNWQHCRHVIFVGVTHSFEKLYQALRRHWRFGVEGEVNVWMISAESEGEVLETIRVKQEAHREMQIKMSAAQRENGFSAEGERYSLADVTEGVAQGENWKFYLGDCVTSMRHIADNSLHFSIFSPPFFDLYMYTDVINDMGNCANKQEFQTHFGFLAAELWRTMIPGRLVAIHCKDLPKYMNRDGAAGLYDFPGDLRAAMEAAGFTYHSRVTIWKDPVIEMQRTKNHGLLHKNFVVRAEACRQGMADYMIVFRKWTPDLPDKQVQHYVIPEEYIGTSAPEFWRDEEDYSIQVWQRYASPVWFDINQTNVLNKKIAKEDQDEKHVCPLQLDVIERCIWLWSNKGETVFSPFAGIGSEGYVALKMWREFVGIELKSAYHKVAVKNLAAALHERSQLDLFDIMSQSQLTEKTA